MPWSAATVKRNAHQWDNHVLPAYRNFLLPYRHHCDLHVVNEAGVSARSCASQPPVAGYVNGTLAQPL